MNSDCPQLASVSLLIDGELADEERSSLMEHLGICDACSRELEELRRLRSALSYIGVDPSARQRISNSLLHLDPKMALARRTLSVPLPIAAAILLLLGLSVIGNSYLGLHRQSEKQGARSGIDLPERKAEPNPGTARAKNPIEPAAGLANAKSVNTDSGLYGNKDHGPNHTTIGSAPKPIVVTLRTGQWTVEFATKNEYRPYAIPKIYSGSFNPSEQR